MICNSYCVYHFSKIIYLFISFLTTKSDFIVVVIVLSLSRYLDEIIHLS